MAKARAGLWTRRVLDVLLGEAPGSQGGHELVEEDGVRAVGPAAGLAHVVPARVLGEEDPVQASPVLQSTTAST